MAGDAGTIVGALRRHALARPDARALVAEHRTVSCGELAMLAGDCAARLASRGIGPGQCIGITIADEIAHAVVALGLAWLGAASIVLPSFDGAPARSRLAGRVGARRHVVARPEDRLPGLEALPLEDVLPANGRPHERPAPLHVDPAALLTWFATSGTTGEAKLIPVHQGRMLRQAERVDAVCTMPLSSLEHHYGTRIFHVMIARGAALAIRGRTRTTVASLCSTLRVDAIVGMPAQVRTLTAEAAEHGRLPPHTVVRTAGARTTARFRRDVLAQLCDAFDVLYAAQECGPIAHRVERDPARVSETVGSLHGGVEVQIVDERGAPVAPGVIGEIRMRAPGMATGYHDDPAATARHFRDGWFQPGDAGSFTTDGELMVYGRADDVMNLAGIKIAPLEIERVLERHPAVRQAVAFPLHSPVHGDVPVAAVQVVDGATVDEDELRSFARSELGLRAPRCVRIVATMPWTAQGKVDRTELARGMSPDVA